MLFKTSSETRQAAQSDAVPDRSSPSSEEAGNEELEAELGMPFRTTARAFLLALLVPTATYVVLTALTIAVPPLLPMEWRP